MTCHVCRHNSDTYDSILDLSLDIVKQVTLQGALKSFVKVETLKGSNMYKCEKLVRTSPFVKSNNADLHCY